MPNAAVCSHQYCSRTVSHGERRLCLDHYQEQRDGDISLCSGCGEAFKPARHPVCVGCHFNRNDRPDSRRVETNAALRAKIETVRRNLTQHAESVRRSEENTKIYCIDPILDGLGWDTHSAADVQRGRSILREHGRGDYGRERLTVDYALLANGEPVAFVEAKLHMHGDRHGYEWEERLRRYANELGEGCGVLTNGQLWLIKLMDGGRERDSVTLDVLEDPDGAELTLRQYLDRTRFAVAAPPETADATTIGATTAAETPPRQPAETPPRPPSVDEIRQRLNDYRRFASERRGVPASFVFTDGALDNVVAASPADMRQLALVPGVGPRTLGLHGYYILECVNHDVAADAEPDDERPWLQGD